MLEMLTRSLRRIAGWVGISVVAIGAFVGLAVAASSGAVAQIAYKPIYAGNADYDSGAYPSKPYYPQKKTYTSGTTSAKKRPSAGVKVAALGPSTYDYKPSKPSITGGSVKWVASAGCLDGSLKSVIYQVASSFGPVTVSSTCRSRSRNARVGGAPRSKHLSGDAADFRVHANVSATYAFLKSSGSVGGLKHYGGGLFHIDNGARRSW